MPRLARKKRLVDSDTEDEEDERTLFFIPSKDINLRALLFYLQKFLGDDSDATPGSHPKNRDEDGYFVRSRLGLTAVMLNDVKQDSRNWEDERGTSRGRTYYAESGTASRRLRTGASGQPSIPNKTRELAAARRAKGAATVKEALHKLNMSPFKREGILQDLPMWIGSANKKKFDVIPDTGATLNILNPKVLKDLSPDAVVDQAVRYEGPMSSNGILEMADGHTIRTTGQVTLLCSFMDCPDMSAPVLFHLCEDLADCILVLVGKKFLETTETLTTFAHRMVARPSLLNSIPRVMRLSSTELTTRSHFRLMMDSELVLACPDTGSEIDLVTTTFAQQLHCPIKPLTKQDPQRIELADGRIAKLSGKVIVTVLIPSNTREKRIRSSSVAALVDNPDDDSCLTAENDELNEDLDVGDESTASTLSPLRTFYVSNALASDVILGQAFLYSIDAYRRHRHAFIKSDSPEYEHTLRGIFVLNKAQNRWIDFWEKHAGRRAKAPALPTTQVELDRALNKIDQHFIMTMRDLDARIVDARSSSDFVAAPTLSPGKLVKICVATTLEHQKAELKRQYHCHTAKVREDFKMTMKTKIAQLAETDSSVRAPIGSLLCNSRTR